MISDLEIALACQATYSNPPTFPPPAGSDVWVRVTLASDGATKIVAIRGSVTPKDWARDFFFAPVYDIQHIQLGRCHAGFLGGAIAIFNPVQQAIGSSPFVIGGHSLGGGEGVGLGGLLILIKRPPLRVVTFGAPRFGMQQFVEVMRPYDVKQFRRGNDPVPTVPWDVPPFLEFMDTTMQTPVGVAQRDPFECHHIEGYVADVTALTKTVSNR